MSPALRRLYALWHQPGQDMDAAWWAALDLASWREPYAQQPLLRPPLDDLIARRLGQAGAAPPLPAIAEPLLADEQRREALCMALGLWALRCPDYVLLKPYREALSSRLDGRALAQLQALLPLEGTRADLTPAMLPARACEIGAAWLADAAAPALRLCRLLWPPSTLLAPPQPVEPVLQKLLRWL
ncbi:type III secretion system domain-containing protein [Chromobacterium sp. ASV23]|uniref:type III secretion system domain-containing protein n=1 Tax=Chromobacterium sp. ASV23 TaxID=2795110 RepID=UPI0018EBAE8E|nr:type III secretion system domain-containing protein [Chromobacterium sp. ASV23]